jgi:hypothetical protein
MTPETIRATLESLYPNTPFCELTYETLLGQDGHDRNAFLAEIGQEALEEEPLAERLDTLVRLMRRRELELGAPVSLAEAARRLGISKSRTFLPAVRRGVVHAVKIGGRLKVPLDELERLAIEGMALPRRRAQPPAHAARGTPRDLGTELAEVRALKYPASR